jgi:hypothetical protein
MLPRVNPRQSKMSSVDVPTGDRRLARSVTRSYLFGFFVPLAIQSSIALRTINDKVTPVCLDFARALSSISDGILIDKLEFISFLVCTFFAISKS